MRKLAAIVLTLLALCLSQAAVRAADLSGVWVIDQPAWERQVDRLVAAMMAQMPPDLLAQMKESGTDPTAAMKEGVSSAMTGTVEFLPDGVVRTTTDDDGATEDARWEMDGDQLTIESDDAGAMVGQVTGDRITLRPVVPEGDQERAMLRDLEFPLIRQP
ncbi:MAG: hypothetical protein AB7I59_27625 [Geminicoccaceae bacterium]